MTTSANSPHLRIGALAALLALAPLSAQAGILRADRPVGGQYIVGLSSEVEQAARRGAGPGVAEVASDLAGFYGVAVERNFTAALSGFTFRGGEAAAEALARDSRVAWVAEDGWAEIASVQSPSPAWGLDRIDQRPTPLDGQFVYATNGAGVDLYVVDTGIRATHQEFGGRVDTVNAFTAIQDGRGTDDCNGHGTHVAGVAGGSTFGVAKGVTIHPVRVLDCNGLGPVSDIIAGVDWITSRYTGGGPTRAVVNFSIRADFSFALETAVINSIAAGVTYVAAAGNDGDDACYLTPGRIPAVITVGATDGADSRWSYSNFGTCVDLFAPGVQIPSAFIGADDATLALTGTSAAAPHVAGAVALFLAANPDATPDDIAAALESGATDDTVVDPGPGSPNRLLYTSFIGSGDTGTADIFTDSFESGFAAWGGGTF